jgi:hypothetical protein
VATIGTIEIGLTATVGSFISGLDRAQASLTGFSIRASGLSGVLLGLTAAAESIGSAAIRASADWETMSVRFEALTGSADKARNVLDQLTALSLATPFEVKNLAQTTQRMVQFGFTVEDTIAILSRLTNVAAMSAEGPEAGLSRMVMAITRIKEIGSFSNRDARLLIMSGVPIYEALAEQMNTSVEQVEALAKRGGIGARDAILAIANLGNDPKFAGLAGKLTATLNGLLTTLNKQAGLLLRDLGNQLVEAFDLKATTRELIYFFGELRAQVADLHGPLMLIGGVFTALRDTAITAIREIIQVMTGWAATVDGGADRVGAWREAVVGVFETISQWINTGVNQLIRFGGYVLEYVVAPLLEAGSQVATLMVGWARLAGNKQVGEFFMGASADLGRMAFKVRLDAQGFMEQPLDAGADAVERFWVRVRAAPFKQVTDQLVTLKGAAVDLRDAFAGGGGEIGIIQALGGGVGALTGLMQQLAPPPPGALAPIKLAGVGETLDRQAKLAGVAQFGSAEAQRTISADWLRMQGASQAGPADRIVKAIEAMKAVGAGVAADVKKVADAAKAMADEVEVADD